MINDLTNNIDEVKLDDKTVVNTSTNKKNGQDKCPKCGATEISLNMQTGDLVCHFCRHQFKPELANGFNDDISSLDGVTIGSGMSDIDASIDDMVTLKCGSCGAEVVVDTQNSNQSRCHWCRNVLSINSQIPNGAVPDIILPFKITKEIANGEIRKFVEKRGFFANKKFKDEFKLDNVMGVYFPYAVVDLNTSASFEGEGEKLIRSYSVKRGDRQEVLYDAEAYKVRREFDLEIDDLTIETSKDKLDKTNKNKTTNIINAIMPFDTENAVEFNANYMSGFTSEKRDSNVSDLEKIVEVQAKDIARFACNDSIKQYNRGVAWRRQNIEIKGSQWKTAYLPVWVYSYQEQSNKLLHYVVVNGRTKEVMGSVPINMPRLLLCTFIVEILGFFLMLFVDIEYCEIFLLSGIVYFIIMYSKYRNSNARHTHEKETKSNMKNLNKDDVSIGRRNGLKHSKIRGANNKYVESQTDESRSINELIDKNIFK